MHGTSPHLNRHRHDDVASGPGELQFVPELGVGAGLNPGDLPRTVQCAVNHPKVETLNRVIRVGDDVVFNFIAWGMGGSSAEMRALTGWGGEIFGWKIEPRCAQGLQAEQVERVLNKDVVREGWRRSVPTAMRGTEMEERTHKALGRFESGFWRERSQRSRNT